LAPSGNDRLAAGVMAGIFLAAVAVFAALSALAPALAAENGVDLNRTRITSDKVIYSGGNETILFQGSVRVRRSDFDLWCRKMTVHLASNGSGREASRGSRGASDFEKIVAEENVRLRMENRNATCRKAIYRSDEETIIMLGDVHLRQGRNRIRGQEVRMDLARNTTEILGSGASQVEATFYSRNQTGQSNGGSEGN
jgi:lipopolysaccharide export system protein LptA